MKPLEPRRPPPPPSQAELWATILALTLMILGIGFALYGLHDAGTIGDTAAVAVMVLVVAVSAGIVLIMDHERQACRDAWTRWRDLPPPFDIYTVWPPALDRETPGDTCEKTRTRRRPRRGGSPFDSNFPADKQS